MADETTTNPGAEATPPAAPRRRTPRRAASRPAGAPSRPERLPEQQVDVLAAFAAPVADAAEGGSVDSPADRAQKAAPARKKATAKSGAKKATATAGAADAPASEGEAPTAPAKKKAPAKSRAKKAKDPVPVADAPESAEPQDSAQAEPEGGDIHLPATALLFQAPVAPRRRRSATSEPAPVAEEILDDIAEDAGSEEEAPAADVAPEGALGGEDETGADVEDGDAETGDASEGGPARRRRRRGGRGRRRGSDSGENDSDTEGAGSADAASARPASGGTQSGATEKDAAADTSGEGGADNGEEGDAGSSRRRRRRRGTREDDGGARAARDEVTALRGSTRLEAKRLRRREGRDAGRRRQIITEAEFLARRESVKRDMVVREAGGVTQIAVLEDDVLVEHYVARAQQTAMVGNVYLGRVQNVLPGMEAAFVDLGRGRNAVLYAGEVNWDAAGLEGQPRRIEQALKSGDQILVQVTKDPIGHKGARLTSQITLAGRYLVLVPSGEMTGISRKLPDTERARLKKILKEIVPEGQGVIVRTAAEGASAEELERDVERLTAEWADIQKRVSNKRVTAPALLKGEPELALRVVRDVFNEDFSSLTVAGAGAWNTISEYLESVAPDLAERAQHWAGPGDVFASRRIDEQLAKGMDRKVWLPSGGSLIIERTEAMTVVDVNTGKFTGSGGTLEETVTRNNLEAAEEIVRQLRLRDIGGMIVIDFIDMVLESNRDLVLRRLIECLGRDRTRHQVAEVTSLGLVQMTRKRVGQGLVETFSTPCEHCNARGFTIDTMPHDHVEVEVVDDDERPRVGRRRSSRTRGGSAGGSGSGSSAGNGAPAPVAPPAPVDEAARAQVKAALAQVAAAAQQAHQAHDEAAAAGGAGSAPAGSDPEVTEAAGPSGDAPNDPPAADPAGRPRRRRASRRTGAPREEAAAAVGVDALVLRPTAGPVVSDADRAAALAALAANMPGAVLEGEIIEEDVLDVGVEVIEGEVYDPPLLES